MYGLFEAEFGVRMIRAEEKIRAVAAAEAEAPRCSAWPPGAPLLLVERLSFTYGDRRWNCAAACTAPSRTTTATS